MHMKTLRQNSCGVCRRNPFCLTHGDLIGSVATLRE